LAPLFDVKTIVFRPSVTLKSIIVQIATFAW